MKIAVDGFGGDNSPQEVVKGCIDAVNKNRELDIVLVGNQEILEKLVREEYDGDKITFYDAPEIITCEEDPVMAIRRKRNSSLVKTFELLKDGVVQGGVSAGSSGAVLSAGYFVTKRIEGVIRPCLIPELPTLKDGTVALADCGANVDCTPEYLYQFAKMGVAYMQAVRGIENPRVGLLNNGAEDTKGNDLTKKTFQLLKESKLNFVGSCEARDILSGDFDVVVSDGFDGNIALKSAEGTANAIFKLLKDGMEKSFRAKLGALLLYPVLKTIKKKLDYNDKGGAGLVGIKKPFVKCHGSSKAKTFSASILQCHEMVKGDLCAKIENLLGQAND